MRGYDLKMDIDKNEILNDINVINKYLAIIRDKGDIKDEFEYLGVSMALFTIFNKMIELGEDIIDSFNDNFVVNKYVDVPEFLYNKKVLSDDQFKVFKSFIIYRNEIAHEYEEIRSSELDWCLNHLNFVEDFVKIVKERLL